MKEEENKLSKEEKAVMKRMREQWKAEALIERTAAELAKASEAEKQAE